LVQRNVLKPLIYFRSFSKVSTQKDLSSFGRTFFLRRRGTERETGLTFPSGLRKDGEGKTELLVSKWFFNLQSEG
jgi:hypothetical protein